ncbi:MAG: 50S ribosomal protein L25/general stress protein Ctc [Pseudomonadota bacterium]
MAETDVFYCELRDGVGTGHARAARREGWVPGVLYGGGGSPVAIKLRKNEVNKAYNAGRMRAQLAKIDVKGEDGIQDVIARDVQTDPVKDFPIHVDLLRVDESTRIDVEVPVRFLNEEASPGLKRGGVLNVVRYTVEIYAPATAIPEFLEADIGSLDIGDVLHISAFALPKGVSPVISDRDFTVATIAAPSSVRSAEGSGDDDGEGAEGDATGGDADASSD